MLLWLRKWIPRLYMLATLFWAIGYLIHKYTKTVIVEETTLTMPLPVLLFIVLLISIITIGGSIIMILSWWERIKQDKFSFYTFAPIALLMLGVSVLAKLLIGKVYVLIELNTTNFLRDLTQYQKSISVVLLIIGSGLIIGLLGMLWELIARTDT